MTKPAIYTFLALLLSAGVHMGAHAQQGRPTGATAQPSQGAMIQDSPENSTTPEAKTERIHIDDGTTQVGELLVRGETQTIEVKPGDMPAYEVIPDSAANPPGRNRDAGQRVWRVLSF